MWTSNCSSLGTASHFLCSSGCLVVAQSRKTLLHRFCFWNPSVQKCTEKSHTDQCLNALHYSSLHKLWNQPTHIPESLVFRNQNQAEAQKESSITFHIMTFSFWGHWKLHKHTHCSCHASYSTGNAMVRWQTRYKKKNKIWKWHMQIDWRTFSTELNLISPAAMVVWGGRSACDTKRVCLLCVSVRVYTPEDRKRKCMRDDNSLSALYKSQSRWYLQQLGKQTISTRSTALSQPINAKKIKMNISELANVFLFVPDAAQRLAK